MMSKHLYIMVDLHYMISKHLYIMVDGPFDSSSSLYPAHIQGPNCPRTGRLTLYADTTSLYYVCFSLYYGLLSLYASS